jgi:response regulator RpfG family c-di-GMP phosphodiesterase
MRLIKDYIARIRDPKDPTTKLSTISFSLVLISSIILGTFISYYLSYQTQKNNAYSVSSLVQIYVKRNLAEKDFSSLDAASVRSEDKIVKKMLEMKKVFDLTRVEILDRHGKVLWADYADFSRDAETGQDLKKVFGGNIDYGYTSIDKTDIKFFKISVPIIFTDSEEVIAVISTYKSLYDISNSIILVWIAVITFMLCGGMIIHFIMIRAIKRSYQQNRILQYELMEYSKELEVNINTVKETQNIAIFGLAKLAESRDKETGDHLERMSLYSKLLAEELATWDKFKFYITKNYIDSIYTSSVLHDIGKVGVPDAILHKPEEFTEEEWDIMKTHSIIGGDALAAADEKLGIESFLTMGKGIAYFHHENFDGKGYPYGKSGEDIPLSARIVAFADAYDAITSKRVYKDAQSFEEAKEILRKTTGKRYDPDMFKAFLNIEDKFIEIADKYRS